MRTNGWMLDFSERLVTVLAYLTLNTLMDSPLWYDTMHLAWSIVYIEGSKVTLISVHT